MSSDFDINLAMSPSLFPNRPLTSLARSLRREGTRRFAPMQQFGRNRPTALSDLAYARFTSVQKRPLGEEGGRLQCSHPLPIHDAKRDCRTHKRSSMCHRSLISANSVRYRRREKLRLGRTFWQYVEIST